MNSPLFCIAKNTFREAIRSKILYSLFFFAIFLIGISTLLGSVTIGNQIKVVKDFGFFAISLSALLYILISGSLLFSKELSRKTLFTLLSRNVRREAFLLGKFLGLYSMALVLILLMGSLFSAFLWFLEGSIDLSIWTAFFVLALELFLLCACLIFFSALVVTPILIGLFTLGIFLAGRSSEFLLSFGKGTSGLGSTLLELLYYLIPKLEAGTVSAQVIGGAPLPLSYLLSFFLYSLSYGMVILMLSCFIFYKREFQ